MVRTHRVVVTAAHQTDENATAPRKAELVLYLVSAIYHYVYFIVYSCAILGRMRVIAGKGSRWTKEESIERCRMFVRGRT